MEKFTYNSKTAEVPSCLDEVSSEQYRQFLILSVLMNRGTISPGQFRVKWLSFLLGMKADYTMLSLTNVGAKLRMFFHLSK